MEAKDFSMVKRAKSMTHAVRGVWIIIKTQPNFILHILAIVAVTGIGRYLHFSSIEWAILILTFGVVLVTEAINTAIEIDIDLTSPTYHPYARDTKDVAAGAVLISASMAIIIGLCIIVPKLV
jgi:diacylglycerol kinase